MKEINLGDSFYYPTEDHEFINVMEIPKKIAKIWLEYVGYDVEINNKQAIVVSNSLIYSYAVYNHDDLFYIIRRRF